MGGLDGASKRLGGSLNGAHMSVGRLNNAFENMAFQIAGVNPALGKAATLIAGFGASGILVTGAIAGLALIAFAWDKITKSAREAQKAQEGALDRLAKTQQGKVVGGQGTVDVATAGAALLRLKAELADLNKGSTSPFAFFSGKSKKELEEEIAATEDLIKLGNQWRTESTTGNPVVAATVKELTFSYNQLREAAAKVLDEQNKDTKDFWRGYIQSTEAALTITQQLARARQALQPSILESLQELQGVGQTIPEFSMPKISLDDGLTKEQIKTRDALIGADDKNTDRLHDAIWGSATQLANTLVSALNIGGGGKGSNLGGAIGGTAGFALGFAFGGGPIGGAIGSTIGNIMGSLVGGLFDHKKAIDTNTAAVRQMTAALLLNSPSGYKVGSARFDATQTIKEFQRDAIRYATRGGAPVMLRP